MGVAMSTTEVRSSSADRLIESFHDAGNTALESVRKFLDTVNGVFPDVARAGYRRPKPLESSPWDPSQPHWLSTGSSSPAPAADSEQLRTPPDPARDTGLRHATVRRHS